MKAIQKGFTLIELMIVVAIIAILMAIALPAYQDYTARAQMSEAMTLASGGKVAVAEYWSDKGAMPADNTAAGMANPADIKGKYVAQVEVKDGVITAKMKDADVASGIQGKSLSLSPITNAGSIDWKCKTDAEKKYLPQTCRQ